MATLTLGPSPTRRDALAKRVRLLVAATSTYNVVEAAVAISAGTRASSTALIGFGLDSVVEVSSGAAVAWQFSARDHSTREAREKTPCGSSRSPSSRSLPTSPRTPCTRSPAPASRLPGIVLAAVSLAVMPLLSGAQREAGRELGSASAVADSKQTLLCTYLSAVLIAGLLANLLLDWSWADPVAALVVAAVAAKEGRDS